MNTWRQDLNESTHFTASDKQAWVSAMTHAPELIALLLDQSDIEMPIISDLPWTLGPRSDISMDWGSIHEQNTSYVQELAEILAQTSLSSEQHARACEIYEQLWLTEFDTNGGLRTQIDALAA